MGFTSGFTGGVTLTLGIAYLTVLTHERNRQAQALQLRSQARVLNGLLEPAVLPPPQTRAELAREERSTLVETAKDRWNDEIENAVRWVQHTDWTEVRERGEGAILRLLGSEQAQKSKGSAIYAGEVAKTKAEEAKEGTINIAEAAKVKATETAASSNQTLAQAEKKVAGAAKEKLGQAKEEAGAYKDAAKVKADRAAAETRSGAHEIADSIKSSGGTVDAARGAIRDAVNKGIEKGKEAIGKVTTAAGIAEQKVKSTVVPTDVEKALRQRYERSSELNKTPEEVLAERYMPTGARDNTVLRGV